jgi:hypothetical protein
VLTGRAGAEVTEVSGEAYGHFTNVSLFGGPVVPVGPAPRVVLPPEGADPALSAVEPSGQAVYGPAKLFGGIVPDGVAVAPGSGPIEVRTKGTTGPGASVTSTVDLGLHPEPVPVTCDGDPPGTTNCRAAGGFGPLPVTQGDEVHSTCTADEKGVTGSTRFVNTVLATSTDTEGAPKDVEPVPEFPPPNYTREGEITNVGGAKWKIIFNEQIVEPDGTITVNAYHMFLLEIAVGEQIVGHVRCSLRGAATSATTLVAGAKTASTTAAPGPTTGATDRENGLELPRFLLAGGLLGAGAAASAFLIRSRRRRVPEVEHPPG